MNARVTIHPASLELVGAQHFVDKFGCMVRLRFPYLVLDLIEEGRRAVEFKPGLPAKAITHYQEVANVQLQSVRPAARVDRQLAEEPSPPEAA